MKNVMAWVAAIIFTTTVAICAAWGDQPASNPTSMQPARPSTMPGKSSYNPPSNELIDQTAKDLAFTHEQTVKVRDLTKAHSDFVEAFVNENGPKMRELQDQLVKAVEADDRNKEAQLQKERETLMKPMGERIGKYRSKLAEVLNKEQMGLYLSMLSARLQRRLLVRMDILSNRLGLSDNQKKRAQDLRQEASMAMGKRDDVKNQEALTQEEQEPIAKAAFEKFVTTVLTEKQRSKLTEMEKPGQAVSEPSSNPSGNTP